MSIPLRDVANELATSSSSSARLVNVAGLGNTGPELRYRVLQFNLRNCRTLYLSSGPVLPSPATLTSRADLDELVANSWATSSNVYCQLIIERDYLIR